MPVCIKPGTKYYWQDSSDGALSGAKAARRHDNLRVWVEENVPKDMCHCYGDHVDEITFAFWNEADAVAFKLKFGL